MRWGLGEIELVAWLLWGQAGDAAPAPGPAGGWENFLRSPIPVMTLLLVLAYFMLLRPEQKRQAQHNALLDGLKKNDRVETIGGILGSVVSVHRDTDEVVLKIDESSNARLRVRCGAIKANLSVASKQSGASKPSGASKQDGADKQDGASGGNGGV